MSDKGIELLGNMPVGSSGEQEAMGQTLQIAQLSHVEEALEKHERVRHASARIEAGAGEPLNAPEVVEEALVGGCRQAASAVCLVVARAACVPAATVS